MTGFEKAMDLCMRAIGQLLCIVILLAVVWLLWGCTALPQPGPLVPPGLNCVQGVLMYTNEPGEEERTVLCVQYSQL